MLRRFILSNNAKCHYRFLLPTEVSTFMEFSLFIPARQTASMNIPAPTLFKQQKHFLVLSWKCENHLRAERNFSLQITAKSNPKAVSVGALLRIFVFECPCLPGGLKLTLCELRRFLKRAVNFLVLDLTLKVLHPGI